MTKTQENNLCRDIGRIARSLERIASAVDKPDGGEKIEVIRCKDCKCWHPQFKTENGNGLGSCDFHDVALVTSKGFCYWAERKE